MFRISTTPAPKAAVSALTVLAAMGASGMVAAAPVELEPSVAAYCVNNWSMNTAASMLNWLTSNTVTYHAQGPAFAIWNTDFASSDIASAHYRLDANGSSVSYGIPAGAVLTFSLITEPWAPGVAAARTTGPLFGTTVGVDQVQYTATGLNLGDVDVDITPIMQTWDANPSAYYGVRFFITSGATRGGVRGPAMTGPNSPTGNLIIDTAAIPEPAGLAVAGLGGLFALRRRRQ